MSIEITTAKNIGITPELLHKKFLEVLSDFSGYKHGGWVIDNQLGSSTLVKEFELNGKTFQCQLHLTRDEFDFIETDN